MITFVFRNRAGQVLVIQAASLDKAMTEVRTTWFSNFFSDAFEVMVATGVSMKQTGSQGSPS